MAEGHSHGHEHGHGHTHGVSADADVRKLAVALGLIVWFMCLEVVLGLVAARSRCCRTRRTC